MWFASGIEDADEPTYFTVSSSAITIVVTRHRYRSVRSIMYNDHRSSSFHIASVHEEVAQTHTVSFAVSRNAIHV
jgi:hypothetical protein